MKYTDTESGTPPRHVTLSPTAFASDYKDRPREDVCIGLRFISVSDIDVSRNTAVRRAIQWMTDNGKPLDGSTFDDILNDQLIYMLVSRAATDANDVMAPYFGTSAEDTIREALTVEGARRLWDELQILHASSGPAIALATDADLLRLSAILRRGEALDKAAKSVGLEVRKMATYLLEQLGALDPDAKGEDAGEDDPDSGEDEDVVIYESRARH